MVPAVRAAPAAPRPAGFEELLAEILPSAYGVARALTGNPADAEDLLQEAALLAFRGFGSFAPGTRFKAWFYRILTHRHFERHRRARRRPATVELGDEPDLYLYRRTAEAGLHAEHDDPAAWLIGRMTAEQVTGAIAELPGELRAVATLFFVEDLTYQDMAEALGCPVGTVRSRLHRARKTLQQRLWRLAVDCGIVEPGCAAGAGEEPA